jgi:uncharacterized membrane protein YeaQ/YmgE (transglycosylase-associated protein family)
MAREHSLTTDLVVGVVGALLGMFVAEILGLAVGVDSRRLLIATVRSKIML